MDEVLMAVVEQAEARWNVIDALHVAEDHWWTLDTRDRWSRAPRTSSHDESSDQPPGVPTRRSGRDHRAGGTGSTTRWHPHRGPGRPVPRPADIADRLAPLITHTGRAPASSRAELLEDLDRAILTPGPLATRVADLLPPSTSPPDPEAAPEPDPHEGREGPGHGAGATTTLTTTGTCDTSGASSDLPSDPPSDEGRGATEGPAAPGTADPARTEGPTVSPALAGDTGPTRARAAYEELRAAHEAHRDGPVPLPPTEAARFLPALRSTAVRDACLLWADDAAWWLWTDLAPLAPPTWRAPVLTLLAAAAYRRGDGVTALAALAHALTDDPAYRLARLMHRVITLGIPPDTWSTGLHDVTDRIHARLA
jgi:hypothetical protein